MNRGSRLIRDQDQKYDLSEMNLQAGKKAIASGAFHTGQAYFLAGLSLLDQGSWDAKYELTMKLYNAGRFWQIPFCWDVHIWRLMCFQWCSIVISDFAVAPFLWLLLQCSNLCAASEALYLNGDFASLASLIEEPLLNARSFQEKMIIYNTSIRALIGKYAYSSLSHLRKSPYLMFLLLSLQLRWNWRRESQLFSLF